MGHYNSTHESGPTLRAYTQQANRQEAAVLALFRRHPGCFMSPSMVCNLLNKMLERNWPITSIRRAITNLTEQGHLEKTGGKVRGPLGRPEYRWTITPQ